MQIKFTKTHPDAVIPTRGSAGAARKAVEEKERYG